MTYGLRRFYGASLQPRQCPRQFRSRICSDWFGYVKLARIVFIDDVVASENLVLGCSPKGWKGLFGNTMYLWRRIIPTNRREDEYQGSQTCVVLVTMLLVEVEIVRRVSSSLTLSLDTRSSITIGVGNRRSCQWDNWSCVWDVDWERWSWSGYSSCPDSRDTSVERSADSIVDFEERGEKEY